MAGVDSISAQGEAQLTGHVTVSEGSGIELTQVGQDIEIALAAPEAVQLETAGAVTASSRGTQMTCGAANTKGSYAELIASTSFAATGFTLILSRPSTAGLYMMDVAIGGAGSESVILANFAIDIGATNPTVSCLIPLAIASGSRVAVRAQSSAAAPTLDAEIILHRGGLIGGVSYSTATTYGADTATSSGTALANGGANTKGAYSQLSASVTGPIGALILLCGLRNTPIANATSALIDVATGGAGAETVRISNVATHGDTLIDRYFPEAYIFPIDIAAGTRLAARAQYSTNEPLDAIVIGFS